MNGDDLGNEAVAAALSGQDALLPDVMGDAGIHIIESTDTDQLTFAAAVLDLALLHEAFLKLHFPVLLGRSGEEDHLSVQLVRDLRICQRQHGTHHTGKFALHLLPSGVFRPGVMNILGNGVALDCENLVTEMETIRAAGVSISPENLMVSHRASLLLPWHRELDALEEARLKDKMYGSTKQGIAPFYSDKYQKKTIQAGELLYPDRLMAHLQDLLEWKNLILQKVYGAKGYTMAEMTAWLETYAAQVRPYVADTGRYLRQAQAEGKAILFEGQLGALRDLDYGIYPYTTSSNTIAAYAPIGAGLPTAKIDEVVGVVKAYSSCVGEGPFTCEWFGADAEKLREAGAEYGAKTGRPRRVGPIDLVATRYGVEVQGATNIALTKLDILSYMNEVPVCAAYEIDGEITHEFPFPAVLERAKPVMEYLPGWGCDISGVRTWADMPQAARDYVEYVEQAIGCHIGYVSVGAERESLIIR